MKKILKYIPVMLVALSVASCKNFLDVEPQGILDQNTAYQEPEKMLTAAYATLGNDWYSYPFNLWPYGDMAADDCMKGGSGENDTGYHPMEIWSTLTNDRGELDELWYRLYFAISRCNRALDAIDINEKLDQATKDKLTGEALFLRAHFYYKLLTMYYQVPWIGLQEFRDNAQEKTSNTQFTHEELMLKVIADFEFAYKVLPTAAPGETNRAHKDAAAAYLAKCYLDLAYGDGYEATTGYDQTQTEAHKKYLQQVVFYTDDLYNKERGYDYLPDFGDIFLPEYSNSKESIFAVQHSLPSEDGTTFGRANWSNMLNGVWKIWSCGWDFHKPTQNLVNAFRVKDGLPDFENFDNKENYNTILVKGVDNGFKYDPRLFHTVGMPSFPYKYEAAYTLTEDNSRNPGAYGYYCSMKEVPQRSKGETFDNPWQAFAMNDYVLRYTDVMLMRAEAKIELNEVGEGVAIINKVRERANNSVAKHIGYASSHCANLATYSTSISQEEARRALRWERRLELAMEGHRYFDLRRWGMASTTLNHFFSLEKNAKYKEQEYAKYYGEAFYKTDKNEYWPIASAQMLYVVGLYTQNKGY